MEVSIIRVRVVVRVCMNLGVVWTKSTVGNMEVSLL